MLNTTNTLMQVISVDKNVKIRKRMDAIQHQIDSLESRLQEVEK